MDTLSFKLPLKNKKNSCERLYCRFRCVIQPCKKKKNRHCRKQTKQIEKKEQRKLTHFKDQFSIITQKMIYIQFWDQQKKTQKSPSEVQWTIFIAHLFLHTKSFAQENDREDIFIFEEKYAEHVMNLNSEQKWPVLMFWLNQNRKREKKHTHTETKRLIDT